MRKIAFYFLFVTCSMLLGSCATIFNGKSQLVSITKAAPIRNGTVQDVEGTFSLRTDNFVVRNKKPLVLQLSTPKGDTTLFIKPHASVAYWSNIYFNAGLCMLLEYKSPKHFEYPRRIYLDYKDSTVKVLRFEPLRKGTLSWTVNLPLINYFKLQNADHNYSDLSGIYGIGTGVEYCYKDNNYISMEAGGAINGTPGEKIGESGPFEKGSSLYFNVRNNFSTGSFDFGYGLSFSKLHWDIWSSDTLFVPRHSENIGAGLSMMAQYRMGEYLRFSFVYQPNFVNVGTSTYFSYQHYMEFGLVWKVPFARVKP